MVLGPNFTKFGDNPRHTMFGGLQQALKRVKVVSAIPVLDYPVRKFTIRCIVRAVSDYKNAVVDGRRAFGTGIYAA